MGETNQQIFYLEKNNLNKTRIKNLVQFILRNEKIDSQTNLNIVITNDEYLQKLNKKFRNIDKSTDVLSFSFNNDFPQIKTQIFGDVYISFEMAKLNAERYKVPIQKEIERLIAHGILHLVGYNHPQKADEDEMSSKTEFYLENFEKEN